MKKIAFVSWDFSVLGGINQVIVTLANKLCEKNEVYIISLTKKNQDNSYKLNEKITPVFYAIDRECRGRKVIFEAKKRLKDFLKTNDIKLLFLMGFQVALPVIIMTERKYKYVFCEHEALMSRWNEKNNHCSFYYRIMCT